MAQRRQTARVLLIETTALPFGDVRVRRGFSSIRHFNDQSGRGVRSSPPRHCVNVPRTRFVPGLRRRHMFVVIATAVADSRSRTRDCFVILAADCGPA